MRQFPTRTSVAIALITAAGAVLRFAHLDQESFWFDESASFGIARLGWHALRESLVSEANMWLYYAILRYWIRLGQSEWFIRSFSAAMGALTIPVIFLLGKRLFNTNAGLIAALLMALNYFHLFYSQEARSYSLVVLLVSLSSLFFLRALESKSSRDWILYALVSVLAFYAHIFAGLVLAAQWLSLALRPHPEELPWRKILASIAATGLLCLPLAIVALMPGSGKQVSWIAKPTVESIRALLLTMSGPGWLPEAYLAMCLAAFIFLSAPLWRYTFLIIWFCFPIVTAFLLSNFKPIFVDRYLIVCLPALTLLAGAGASRLRPRWLLAAAMALLLVPLSSGVRSYYDARKKEDFRGAFTYVVSQRSPHELVMFYVAPCELPFSYYAHLTGHLEIFQSTIHADGFRWYADAALETVRYTSIPPQYQGVWLVECMCGPTEETERARIRSVLANQFPEVFEKRFSNMDVIRYQRKPAP